MGDPRKARKKYKTPSHPWQGARIEDEKQLSKEYGLKNKKEVWKMASVLRDFSDRAKRLVAENGKQAEKEKLELMTKLKSMGLVNESADLDDVMGLSIRDILDRRLQSQVYSKNLAKSVNQARQFITHGHVTVGSKTITTPSYLVTIEDAPLVAFSEFSQLSDVEHPERSVKPEPTEDKKEDKEKETKKPAKKKKEESKEAPAPKKEAKKEPDKKEEEPTAKETVVEEKKKTEPEEVKEENGAEKTDDKKEADDAGETK